MRPFRDLEVHKQGHALGIAIYAVTAAFPREEQFGLTSQIRRAAVSIPTNIAEGSARGSDREFRQFLYTALGSAAEVEYLLLLSRDLGYLGTDSHDALQENVASIKRMLVAFISRLSGEETPWTRRTGGRHAANSQQLTANSPREELP